MSKESVEAIITRAMEEQEYRELLLSDPEKALEGYQLSVEESALFENLETLAFDDMMGELGERVSRAGIILGFNPGDHGTGSDLKSRMLHKP
jgi:hypothetical protein